MSWFKASEKEDYGFGWKDRKNPIDELKSTFGKETDLKLTNSPWQLGNTKKDDGGFGWK